MVPMAFEIAHWRHCETHRQPTPPFKYRSVSAGQASAPACKPDLLFCTFGVLIRMSKQASQHMWRLQPVYTFQRVGRSVSPSVSDWEPSHRILMNRSKAELDHPPARQCLPCALPFNPVDSEVRAQYTRTYLNILTFYSLHNKQPLTLWPQLSNRLRLKWCL